jgi:CDP-diglyceride synthetase
MKAAQWALYLLLAVVGTWANYEWTKINRVIQIGPNRWAVVNERAMGAKQ